MCRYSIALWCHYMICGSVASCHFKNFFDLIIIDECHRGSAKEESAWREVLYLSECLALLFNKNLQQTYWLMVGVGQISTALSE